MLLNRERTFIRIVIVCCFLAVTCATAVAQSASLQYDKAVEFFHNAELNRADSLFQTLEAAFVLEKNYETLTGLYSYRSSISRRQGRQKQARHLLQQAEETASSGLDPGHIILSRIYTNRAFLHISESDFDAAREWANKSLEVSLTHPEEYSKRAESWLAVGYVHGLLGEYDKAFSAYTNGLSEAESGLENDYLSSLLVMISLNNNLGIVNRHLGNPQRALENYEANQHLIDARFHSEHPEAAHNFNNIGAMLFEAGDVKEAISYFLRSATILEKSYGAAHSLLAAAYNNIGSAYALLNRPGFAAHYLEKSLEIKKALPGENHPDMSVAYANLASQFRDAGEYEEALDHVNHSVKIRLDVFGKESLQLIMPRFLRSKIYLDMNRPGEALNDIETILTLTLSKLGPEHRHSIEARVLKAAALQKTERLDEALETVQQAVNNAGNRLTARDGISVSAGTPSPYPQLLLDALSGKAEIRSAIYEQSAEINDLKSSFRTWLLCIDLIEELQFHFRRENIANVSARVFDGNNDNLFERAIDTAYRLYRISGNPGYIDSAFTLMEKSKARSARMLLTESDARVISGIPAFYTQREESLRHTFNTFERELSVEMARLAAPDHNLIRSLQDSLFQTRLQQQAFSELLKKAFPRYFQLKYDRRVAEPESVRKKLAASGSNLISYYAGSEHLFAVTYSENGSGFYRLSPGQDLESQIHLLRQSVLEPDTGLFPEVAHDLYKKLVEPLKGTLASGRILLLPDRSLNYLPFELLLTQKKTGSRYHEWPWLIRDFDISYAPSATVLQQMEREESSTADKLLIMAPFASVTPENRADTLLKSNPENLPLLPFSRYEAEEIVRLFTTSDGIGSSVFNKKEATILINSDATVNRLNSLSLDRYKYVHFATHALISDREPALSGIHLADDGTDANTLFLHDIYRLNLNADMVVLSGCESGFGPLAGSEGIIGFARAFILGGTASLITSHWKVDDRSTSELMIRFYRELMQGENKSAALRKAKLAMISKPETASPSRWAAFVLAGR